MVLLQAWLAACLHSIRALIVKQGIEVTSAGKGELNSAIAGLGSLAGIVGPGLLWGPLYKSCSSNGSWLGKGGHYFACSAVMLVASLVLRLTPDEHLFVDEKKQLEREI